MAEDTRLISYEKWNESKGAAFKASWYIASEEDRLIYEQKYADIATWAEPSPSGVYPGVMRCHVESLIPHSRSAPYIITTDASFDSMNMMGATSDSLLDKSSMRYSIAQHTLDLSWFGMRVATAQDAGWRMDKNTSEWSYDTSLAIKDMDDNRCKEGDVVYKNATKDDKGSAAMAQYSPYTPAVSLDDLRLTTGTDYEAVLTTTFYTNQNLNDIVFKIYRKCNGSFPSNLRPKVTAGKKWLCSNEEIDEVQDTDGQTILKVVRTFRYSYDSFYWNTAYYPQWSSWI